MRRIRIYFPIVYMYTYTGNLEHFSFSVSMATRIYKSVSKYRRDKFVYIARNKAKIKFQIRVKKSLAQEVRQKSDISEHRSKG